MRKQIASSFILSFSSFWFSKLQLCCRMGKREKAVNEEGGWKLSRKKSRLCLVLCAFQNGNATLIKVSIKQTIQGNKMVFGRLGRRRRGRSERGNKMRALLLKETAKCSTRERKYLQTFHWRMKEYIISVLTTVNNISIAATQTSAGVYQDSGEKVNNGVTSMSEFNASRGGVTKYLVCWLDVKKEYQICESKHGYLVVKIRDTEKGEEKTLNAYCVLSTTTYVII